MAFQEKVISLGTLETLVFECPPTLSGSVHGLVFSNITGSNRTVTLKIYTKSTGVTTTISQGRTVAANGEFTWPKPINVAAGDQIIAQCDALNSVTTLAAVYLNATQAASAGFTPRGAHSVIATYAPNDVVELNGSSYVALTQNINSVPPSADWMILASKGTVGDAISIAVNDEGSSLTSQVTSFNFTGTGVTATVAGSSVEVAIPAVTKTSLALDAVENKSSATIRGEITSGNVTTALGFAPVNPNTIGAANGVTPLGADSKVPAIYLPAYVDDVLEGTLATFPATGEAGKIYVDTATNKQYRWSGTVYSEISSSPGTTDVVSEGASNKYFTENRVLSTILSGLSTAAGTVVASTHTVLQALGFLQKQVTDLNTSVGTKANALNPTFTGTVTLPSQVQNTMFAAPNGSSGVPSFRALVPADIPALSYSPVAGSASITTVGTISTGTWQGSLIGGTYGGTGANNGARTISYAGNVAFAGAFATTITVTAATTVTLPTSGSLISSNTGIGVISGTPSASNFLCGDGTWKTPATATGTVTSVALSLPAMFTVSGSPVTTTGTLSATLANQTAAQVFASPSGATGAPTFRALVASDIPALSYAPAAGSASVTTLGTISTGTWQGTVVGGTYGGTGVNNGARTISYAGNVAFAGAFATNITVTAATTVTLPTSGSLIASTTAIGVVSGTPSASNFLCGDGTWKTPSGGAGTVTSVALSLPAMFTVSGSPVTTTGTLSATLASQTAAQVLASPTGAAGVPTFRALAATDIPALSYAPISGSANYAPASGSANYAPAAGSASVTTLGTIGTGTWQGTVIGGTYGGTGVNNGARTITYAGNVAFTGAFTFSATLSANTAVTFPTGGTLFSTVNVIPVGNGGTGVNSLTGIVKGNGSSAMTAAIAGTDYQMPIGTISGMVKGNGANALIAAVAGTDFQGPIGTISGLAKGNGANALTAAVAGTDFLAPAAIGSTVQAYSANLLTWANKTAPSGVVAGLTDVQTFTNKTFTGYTETIFDMTTGFTLDPTFGTIQTKTLTGNGTFLNGLYVGTSIVLMLNPATFTATWPTTSWVNSAGTNTAPTLKANAMNVIVFWRIGSVLYGNWIGSL